MRTAEQLGWYRYLVHNNTAAGSLFTLLHLPFMASFVSWVALGALPLGVFDAPVMAISMAAVATVLYGEHMIDDTTMVGKPWDTVFNDRTLLWSAAGLFVAGALLSVWSSLIIGSAVPLIGISAGISFSILYGMEVWRFHAVWFGAVGMGAIPPFSYLAQAIALGHSASPAIIAVLFVLGSTSGYIMLGTYERTRMESGLWKELAIIFLIFYSLGILSLLEITV